MQISARNQLPGKVIDVSHGVVNGTVKVDVGNGTLMTSSITEEAIAELAIRPGDDVILLIKASDVMIVK